MSVIHGKISKDFDYSLNIRKLLVMSTVLVIPVLIIVLVSGSGSRF